MAVVCVRLVVVVTVIAIICRPVGVGGERGKGGSEDGGGRGVGVIVDLKSLLVTKKNG